MGPSWSSPVRFVGATAHLRHVCPRTRVVRTCPLGVVAEERLSEAGVSALRLRLPRAEAEGGPVTVFVRLRPDGDWVLTSMRDAVGTPDAELKRLFAPCGGAAVVVRAADGGPAPRWEAWRVPEEFAGWRGEATRERGGGEDGAAEVLDLGAVAEEHVFDPEGAHRGLVRLLRLRDEASDLATELAREAAPGRGGLSDWRVVSMTRLNGRPRALGDFTRVSLRRHAAPSDPLR